MARPAREQRPARAGAGHGDPAAGPRAAVGAGAEPARHPEPRPPRAGAAVRLRRAGQAPPLGCTGRLPPRQPDPRSGQRSHGGLRRTVRDGPRHRDAHRRLPGRPCRPCRRSPAAAPAAPPRRAAPDRGPGSASPASDAIDIVTDPIPDLLGELSSAQAGCWPFLADYTTSPPAMAVAEAMAVGLPVVSTPVACVRSVMRPDLDGIAVPPGDSVALGAALVRLLTDPEAWDAYSAAGQSAVSGLTWEKAARATSSLYGPMSFAAWQPFFLKPYAPTYRELHGTRKRVTRKVEATDDCMTTAPSVLVPAPTTPARPIRPTRGDVLDALHTELAAIAQTPGIRAAWQGPTGAAEPWRTATGLGRPRHLVRRRGLRGSRRRAVRVRCRARPAGGPPGPAAPRVLRHRDAPRAGGRRPHPRRPHGRAGPAGAVRADPHGRGRGRVRRATTGRRRGSGRPPRATTPARAAGQR